MSGTAFTNLRQNRRLFSIIGANMNATTDQVLTPDMPLNSFYIDRIMVTNASISLTLAAGGIYTSASKGGVAVVAAAQTYAALTASGKTLILTLANSDIRNTGLILSLTTAQGAAATCDVNVYGWGIS